MQHTTLYPFLVDTAHQGNLYKLLFLSEQLLVQKIRGCGGLRGTGGTHVVLVGADTYLDHMHSIYARV